MPLLLFEGRSGKLILPIPRPGRGNKAINIAGLLKRLILKLRKKWKHTQIIVRGDTYFCYCNRGRMEQMIAELKNGLKADRMSCNKFSANQFRLYLHCAVYVILHSFQTDSPVGTELECSTITTMREKLLLSAVSID